MAKREILAALKRKGLAALECDYAWTITSGGEHIPCWSIELDEASLGFLVSRGAAAYGLGWRYFDNTPQALAWIASLPANARNQLREPGTGERQLD